MDTRKVNSLKLINGYIKNLKFKIHQTVSKDIINLLLLFYHTNYKFIVKDQDKYDVEYDENTNIIKLLNDKHLTLLIEPIINFNKTKNLNENIKFIILNNGNPTLKHNKFIIGILQLQNNEYDKN